MEDALYLELHKLSAIKSEEALDQLLSTLWETRKTGLRQKSHFQSLLNLQSPSDLDPVLACLRSLLRKWVRENLATLPRLKSMTWTMDNSSTGSADRVVVLNLKLQDHTDSSLDEIDVKFLVTRDTLGAMIKSLTYIREQLSSLVGAAPEPSQKKQKQSVVI